MLSSSGEFVHRFFFVVTFLQKYIPTVTFLIKQSEFYEAVKQSFVRDFVDMACRKDALFKAHCMGTQPCSATVVPSCLSTWFCKCSE